MRRVLAAGCCLILVHFSACLRLRQTPRFIGIRCNKVVILQCSAENNLDIQWFRASVYNGEKKLVERDERTDMLSGNHTYTLKIKNVMPDDSGVYFCSASGSWGLGTELKVLRNIPRKEAMKKSQTKDVFIVLQALLLMVCALIPAVLYVRKVTREDRIYEEPEENHLYEGLQIEHCDLYEDIPAYSQPSEAPWEGPESPCEE